MSGEALAEMESEERLADRYDIREHGFPFVLKSAKRRALIEDWPDLLECLESDRAAQRDPAQGSHLSRLACYKEESTGKRLALSSLVSLDIAPYFDAYARATSKSTRGYLFAGEYEDQPNILCEALLCIEHEIGACELRKAQTARQQARLAQSQHQ